MVRPYPLKFIIVFVFLCLCHTVLDAQQDSMPVFQKQKKCHKRVGYFASRNPEKLVRKLTKGLQSDSEKVAAIHCWITTHIRYDIRKYLNNDYIVKSNRYILRHRKAICYGYASLFKELCQIAGIQAVIVTGYTKNSDIDICDSFYLEDHAWNAVFINHRWYLSDLTWDAGYILQWKRSWVDQLVYVFTLGRKDHIRNKVYFKRSPRWDYYLKTGDYFYYDHMPANRIWQLMGDTRTIDDFKTDSTWYYLKPRDSADTYSNEFEAERQTYFSNTDTLNEIVDGFAFTDYNFRNHYQIIISNNLLSKPFNDELNFKSKDTLYQLKQADSVISYCSKSLLHADSNVYYLKEQLEMQLKHIAIKNNTLKTQNNQLKKTSSRTINHARKGLRIKGRLETYIRNSKVQNRKNVDKIMRDKKILETRSAAYRKTEDSARLANKIGHLDSLIGAMNATHDSMMDQATALLLSIFPKLQNCIDFQHEKTNDVIYAILLRKYGSYDDLDYPVRKLKDSLMVHDELHDSDLFSGKRLLYDSLYKAYQNIQNHYKLINRTYKLKLTAIRQLKTKCPAQRNPEIMQMYKDELAEISETLVSYTNWQNDFRDLLDSSQAQNRRIKQGAKQNIRYIMFEKKFRIRTSRFRKNTKALMNLNKIREREASKQFRKAKKIRKKFTRVKKV